MNDIVVQATIDKGTIKTDAVIGRLVTIDTPVYTGATTFTVADNNIVIATNGKRLNSDITIDISDVETLAEEISEVVG